tara:strand:- start:3093 stop:3335 length:243 start_codon:yes stop_codon:yes gene_type:complete
MPRSRSSVIHFTLTIVGVGDCLDEAFLDAIERLEEHPAAAISGDVEWKGDGRLGDFKVIPAPEDDDEPIPEYLGFKVGEA